MTSLKTNVVLNIVHTLTGIIFPIITFPYAARILLPEGIGTIGFLQSIISYIVLFTSLGIPLYAVREVARCKDNIKQKNTTTFEILVLSLLLCALGYVAVFIIGEAVPQINSNLKTFYILSLTILFSSLGVNWFYQAIEDFKFITIRSVVFRIISTLALFVFVKDSYDLNIYALVTVGSTVGNNIINIIHLRKYIQIGQVRFQALNIWRHFIPALRIFVLNLVTSIYVHLNTILLGFMNGDEAVGYYYTGNRLTQIILTLITALGSALLPRCSNLVENSKWEEFKSITRKSYLLIFALSLPASLGLIILKEPIVNIFFGQDYAESARVLAWTAPTLFLVGLTNLIGIQILYPRGKENIVIISTLVGAVVSVVLNLFLIPFLSYVGAAISTLVAEFFVLIVQLVYGKKYVPFRFIDKSCLNYVVGSVLVVVTTFVLTKVLINPWLQVVLCFFVGIAVYLIWLIKARDSISSEIVLYVKSLVGFRSNR